MYHVQSLESKSCLWGGLLGNELDPFSRGLTAGDFVMLRGSAPTLTSILCEQRRTRQAAGKATVNTQQGA